jgi:hypothetical protein
VTYGQDDPSTRWNTTTNVPPSLQCNAGTETGTCWVGFGPDTAGTCGGSSLGYNASWQQPWSCNACPYSCPGCPG